MWNTGFLPSPAWCAISCRLTWPWNARRLNMGNHKTSDQFLPSPVQRAVLSRLNWQWLHQRVKHRKTQTMIKWTLDWNPKVSNTGNHKTHDWFLPSPVQHAVLLFETKWQWNTKESNTADSSPPLSNVQFFFRDKMTVNHQRAKHSRFLPFPVQCPLFSGQNDRETPKSQTWPIPTLPCPMSIESNTGNHKTHDSYHLLLDVLFHLLFGWKMYVTFAHLAEPPGLDLGHGQHPSRGWLHKADKGQTGSHTWREHVFVQLSKKKNDECVNKRTLKKMETTSKRDKGYLSLYAFCHSQKRGLYP